MKIKLINKHHNSFLAKDFAIKKTEKVITQNYYWIFFCNNV